MSLERSSSALAEVAPARAQSGAPTAVRAAASHAGRPAPGGFSSLLFGLGEAPLSAPATPLDALDPLAPCGVGLSAPQAASATADSAAQALLAQFLGLGVSLPATPSDAGASTLAPTPGTLGAALAGGTELPGGASPAGQGSVQEPQATATAGLRRSDVRVLAPAPLALSASAAAAQAQAAQEAVAGSQLGAALGARVAQGHAQERVLWQQTQLAQDAAQQSTWSRAPVRDTAVELSLAPLVRVTEVLTPSAGVALAAWDTPARTRERSTAGSERVRSELFSLSGTGSGALDVSAAPGAGTAPAVERAVAEQVSAWISSDIRHAELKLDGLGPQAVQVSITMSGNEAQVVFRSDQAQTRELLGNAMAQLDQLLQGQGLSLGGAWVGTSGQQGEAAPDAQAALAALGRAPESLRREPESQHASTGAGATSRRMLDLFV